MAVEAADIALFTNDLRVLRHLLCLGRAARRTIIQNIGLALTTKARDMLSPMLWVDKLLKCRKYCQISHQGQMSPLWRRPGKEMLWLTPGLMQSMFTYV